MHHALAMGVAQGISHLAGDQQGVFERKLTLTSEPLAKTLPIHERHRIPQLAGGFA
jgi:hypothetical protein